MRSKPRTNDGMPVIVRTCLASQAPTQTDPGGTGSMAGADYTRYMVVYGLVLVLVDGCFCWFGGCGCLFMVVGGVAGFWGVCCVYFLLSLCVTFGTCLGCVLCFAWLWGYWVVTWVGQDLLYSREFHTSEPGGSARRT